MKRDLALVEDIMVSIETHTVKGSMTPGELHRHLDRPGFQGKSSALLRQRLYVIQYHLDLLVGADLVCELRVEEYQLTWVGHDYVERLLDYDAGDDKEKVDDES